MVTLRCRIYNNKYFGGMKIDGNSPTNAAEKLLSYGEKWANGLGY